MKKLIISDQAKKNLRILLVLSLLLVGIHTLYQKRKEALAAKLLHPLMEEVQQSFVFRSILLANLVEQAERHPNTYASDQALLLAGTLYEEIGYYFKAVKVLKQCQWLSKDDALEKNYRISRCLYKRGEYNEAAQYIEKNMALGGQYADKRAVYLELAYLIYVQIDLKIAVFYWKEIERQRAEKA